MLFCIRNHLKYFQKILDFTVIYWLASLHYPNITIEYFSQLNKYKI